MASAPSFDTQNADQRVKTLVNAQLKIILKKEKLAVSGLKAAMQHRIISRKDESQSDPAEDMSLSLEQSTLWADFDTNTLRAPRLCKEPGLGKVRATQGIHQQSWSFAVVSIILALRPQSISRFAFCDRQENSTSARHALRKPCSI